LGLGGILGRAGLLQDMTFCLVSQMMTWQASHDRALIRAIKI